MSRAGRRKQETGWQEQVRSIIKELINGCGGKADLFTLELMREMETGVTAVGVRNE